MGLETGAIIGLAGLASSTAGGIMNSVQGSKGPTAVFPDMQRDFKSGMKGVGKQSMSTMEEMARTGMPTDVGPMFQALLQQREKSSQQGRASIAEKFGSMGLRYSTPLMDSLVDYENQLQADYGSILSNYVFQAMEAARGRQMQASGMGMEALGTGGMAMMGQPQSQSPMAGIGQSLSLFASGLQDVKWGGGGNSVNWGNGQLPMGSSDLAWANANAPSAGAGVSNIPVWNRF